MTRVFATSDELKAAVGDHLGYGEWLSIDQDRIDTFAAATGDHQWIHVDAERAAAGPYEATIAHGYLTLSLVPMLVSSVVEYAGWRALVNYGSDKIRFLSVVRVGSRVRAGMELAVVRPVSSGLQVTNRITVEIEGGERPALVAETLTLLTN